jgi:hypothetical protein
MGNLPGPQVFAQLLAHPRVTVRPRVFVELGTFEGRTAAMATEWFDQVHTVELSPEYSAKAAAAYPGLGIQFHQGDSRTILPRLAAEIQEPAVFYHDAHPTITWAEVIRDGLFIHGTATMYRRATIARIHGWDEELGTAEEFDAHLRMLHAGVLFRAVDAVTVTYRRHPGGKSQDRFRRRRLRAGVMRKIYDRLGLTPDAEVA